jgi:isoquinoline 1-oxidoreductase alpha subunit
MADDSPAAPVGSGAPASAPPTRPVTASPTAPTARAGAPVAASTPANADTLLVNGRALPLDPAAVDPAMPLLWVLRDVLNLTGTKFGCGVGACGACTVRIDGRAQRSCVTPLSAALGRPVTTIEGLGEPTAPHALQQAWIEHQVPQCGWCQSGLLMAAAALLDAPKPPTDAEIEAAIGNLCRCGSIVRVRAAIRAAAARLPRRAPRVLA